MGDAVEAKVNMSIEVILLDVDGTLADVEGVGSMTRLLPGAREAIDMLHAYGYRMSICSQNRNAQQLLRDLEIDRCIEYYSAETRDYNKLWNLQQIRARYPKVAPSRMLLFDDSADVVSAFRAAGISARLVGSAGLQPLDVIQLALVPPHDVFGYALNPFE